MRSSRESCSLAGMRRCRWARWALHRLGLHQIPFNTPSEGDKYALQLEHGDVVVMFTDGITDNMFPNEIVAQVSTSATATEIADKIGMGALVLSNTARASPFAKKWAEHAKRRVPLESKPDDITVVVAKRQRARLTHAHGADNTSTMVLLFIHLY